MNEFGADIKGAFSHSAEDLIVSVRSRCEERRVRLVAILYELRLNRFSAKIARLDTASSKKLRQLSSAATSPWTTSNPSNCSLWSLR
jgi:hypothetical protein